MNSTRLFLILLPLAILQGCTEELDLGKPEKIQFVFNVGSQTADGGKTNSTFQLPTGSALMISVVDQHGSSVLDHHRIELLKLGDDYISHPIDLAPGQYKLIDFFVVDESSEILFAVPHGGAPFATLVSHPLPYSFSVQKNGIKNIAMEVVSVSHYLPEDFGYVSFGVGTVNPIQLAVFTKKNNGLALSSASVYILAGQDTVESYSIGAKISFIPFKQDITQEFTLVVVKDGFARFSRRFVYEDLMLELDARPLEVILPPAFTMVAFGGDFNIQVGTSGPGNIHVDWGDGTSNSYAVDGPFNELGHVYHPEGTYYVSITGSLEKVTSFSSFYDQGMIDRINFESLPSLTEIRFGLTRGARVVDLSHNTKLETVVIVGIRSLEILKIPADNQITSIIVEEQPLLPMSAFDDIIHSVYQSVVRHRKSGYMGLDVTINQLSSRSVAELTWLKDAFGWEIAPDPGE
jgi:hypothetical protein